MATLLYATGPLHSPSPRRPMLSRPRPRLAPLTPPHDPTIISTFSPPLPASSPPAHPTTSSNVLLGRSSFQAFLVTQSRVIRIFNLPKDPTALLATLFPAHSAPLTLWALRHEYGGPPPGEEDSVWAVFQSHSQAAAALSLSGATVSIATALEADLEPFQKLRKLELRRHSVPNLLFSSRWAPSPTSSPAAPDSLAHLSTPLRSHSASDLREHPPVFGGNNPDHAFTLSSNPPNPRNTFRQGDWICTSPSCAAHNFMRNVVCIGCGNPRPPVPPLGPSPTAPFSAFPWPRVASSPRFAQPSDYINGPPRELLSVSSTDSRPLDTAPPRSLLKKPSLPTFHTYSPFPPSHSSAPFVPPTHPGAPFAQSPSSPSPSTISAAAAAVALKLPSLLTPSGRTFSRGGKVQNVSSDPLAPCVMYWPDNEPRPSQGQIRPPGPGHAAPILNTGNKGPIEQQPGDWVCGVCDYLNWRRRKVCQTCYPYAEGNTDGVSAAVQAERIAMLAQVLAAHPQTQAQVPQQLHNIGAPIPHSTATPPHPHAHAIPTPPNELGPLPPLRLHTTTARPPHPSPPLTPEFVPWSLSFLHDEDEDSVGDGSASPSPQNAAPPHVPGPLGASIWALRKDEV